MHEDSDKSSPAETNASAAVATPPAQIVAPQAAQPVAQPAAPVAPPVQQPAAPVINGVPATEQQPNL